MNVTNTVTKSTTKTEGNPVVKKESPKNPFFMKEDWVYQSDRKGGYCKASLGKTSYEGETFDVLTLSGTTGDGGTYEEMANFNDFEVRSFKENFWEQFKD